VFDALVDRLPGTTQRHAVPAEDPRPPDQPTGSNQDPLLAWALSRLDPALAGLLDPSVSQPVLTQGLLDAGVAEVAVRCHLVLAGLLQSTQASLEPLLRSDPNVSREELSQWAFDTRRIPARRRNELEQRLGASLESLQDWQAAEGHARRVTELAPDLAWGWEIAGYAAERRGDRDAAIQRYRQATQCSAFTDQSIRLRTHWMSDRSAKFAAARLGLLDPQQVDRSVYLRQLCDPQADRRRSRIMAYWIDQARHFGDRGDDHHAHRCLVAAGWDLGAEPISVYAELLEQLALAADRCGQTSRGEIARTHRRCLRDRYGS
jgi:tetratricopeptide (TPR) repeat protein